MPKAKNAQFDSVLKDREIVEELMEITESGVELPKAKDWGVTPDMVRTRLGRNGGPAHGLESMPTRRGPIPPPPDGSAMEAIVLLRGRPTLLVKDNTFDMPQSRTWRRRLLPNKAQIEKIIPSVGRVELSNHPSYDWVGTGWVVGERTIVTNRHVAQTFSERKGNGFAFIRNFFGGQVGANIDFREEHDSGAAREVGIEKILFVEDPGTGNPDMAILRLASSNAIPAPIEIHDGKLPTDGFIGVIGYPARDSRNEADAMDRIFGDVYDVKRLAPGKITSAPADHYFTHDCSTLGGNSGSVVFEIETGRALGLHFAGRYRMANYAVKGSVVKKALTKFKVSVPGVEVEERPQAAGTRKIKYYKGRKGFDERFLGRRQKVALPGLGRWKSDAAAVKGSRGRKKHVAPYMHFSVATSKSRQLPLYTAVNINGDEARRIARSGDRWYLDPRIPETAQTGNEAYRRNDLDRGHMVRRLDPVWGEKKEAKTANEDTFHYANSCPQHKDLNRRHWVGLEDYILDNANARDLKVSVLTGPVFKESDPDYRDIKLPREYWKVAVLVNDETGKLSATGYMLSQADMITDLEEFVFGKFRTYQVPIAKIEKVTGLRFGTLKKHDPLRKEAGVETVGVPSRHAIEGPADLVF